MLQNDVIKCCKLMSPHSNEPATWGKCVSRRHIWQQELPVEHTEAVKIHGIT